MTDLKDYPSGGATSWLRCVHCGELIVDGVGGSWIHSETGEGRCALYAAPSEETPCNLY